MRNAPTLVAQSTLIGTATFATFSAISTLGTAFALVALMFNGPTASGYGMGVGVYILSGVILAAYSAWRDQLPGAASVVQDETIPLIAGAMTAAAATMTAGPEVRVATVFAILATSTLLTGALMIIFGQLRLGSLVRFIPYPVIAGFLAGAGWLMIDGGLSLVLGASTPRAMLHALADPSILARVIPSMVFAMGLWLGCRRLSHPLFIPGAIVLAAGLFYAATAGAGLTDAEVRALGWLPSVVSAGHSIAFPTPSMLPLVEWSTVIHAVPLMLSASVVSIIVLLLNTSGLELALGLELDPNAALRSNGISNLLTGAVGGMTGFIGFGRTVLAQKMGALGRSAGLARAATLLASLAVAGHLASAMPVFLTGGIVIFIGIDLFYPWGIASRRRLPLHEWIIVPLILAVIMLFDFLAGLGAGLLVAVGTFAFTYSRLPVVRFSASGRDLRSTVDRSAAATAHLLDRGGAIEVMHLQGFLFFGSAERIVDQVRARLRSTAPAALRHLIIDFRHVSGVDSAAIACFMKLRKLTHARDIDVAFTEVPERLVKQFHRAGIDFGPAGLLVLEPDVNTSLERCEAVLLADLAVNPMEQSLRDQLADQLELSLGMHPPLDTLVAAMERLTIPAGTLLIRTGDTARDIFLVERGQLAVQVAGQDGTPIRLRTMTAGAIVGEVALYTRQPRGADVFALEETIVYRLSEASLARLEAESTLAAVLVHRLVAMNLSGKLTVANRLIQRARL